MPLAFRTIQPAWLGRKPLSEDEQKKEIAPIAVCHNACLGAIVQLASLVRHADDIFCDLAEECQRIFEKTENISSKVQNIERIITQLDSTEVKIPVGTLKQFSTVADHHVAKHGFDCDHFTPANRPYCIRFNYSMCELTPVRALSGVDPFRKDGLNSSLLFKLWPIALKDTEVQIDDVKVPRRFSSQLAQKKRYKALKLKERRRTIHSVDEICNDEQAAELQASREDQLSKSQPSIMVSVDVSGSGFERMALFRQSLSEDGNRSRNKRRRTVSGVPENIIQEIEQFEKGRRILRNGPRKYSLDDLDQQELEARDKIMQQYLVEMDSAIAEREEEEYAQQRETKLLKFIPCRRSRSLPRCVKLITSRGREDLTLTSMFSKNSQSKLTNDVRLRPMTDGVNVQDRFASTASLGSLSGEESKPSTSSKRSSLIGNTIKSLVSGTLKPRPKSLDLDSIEVKNESNKRRSLSKSQGRSSSLSRVSSPNMPEAEVLSRTDSTESQVGPGSYYYFDSNTLPRAQAKKYDFPWDSLPKDWTTSVKLREISKRRKEDRQSSSGNWSQSGYSSNRQSVDSDAKSSKPCSSMSQFSLGKDSGRDSPRSTGERDDAGYMGDAASTETISDTKSISNTDSDDWIRSLAEQAANRGDVTSMSADALANLSRLTKQNIRNLDILVPGRTHFRQKRNELEDDGESSVYSIDQEGFYTSFHSDSGLKKSTNNLLDDEDDDLIIPRVRESKSMQSMTSGTTVKSVVYRLNGNDSSGSPTSLSSPNLASLSFINNLPSDIYEAGIVFPEDDEGGVEYGDSGTLKAKKKTNKKKKPPPLPPPRTTSINSNTKSPYNASDEGLSSLDDSPVSIETSSESSDHETIYARLKKKTSISAHTIPSWCAGMVSDEDDFQDRLNAESSEVEELFSGKDNWLSGTLPRKNITSGTKTTSDGDQSTNSWPRLKRTNSQQPGILKTQEKVKTRPISINQKVLNFDPVVNLFDACSPHGVQMPLSRLSSSDESNSPGTSTFEAHPLGTSLPISVDDQKDSTDVNIINNQESLPRKEFSSKFHPTTSNRHESCRPRSMVLHPSELTVSSAPAHHSGLYSGDLSAIHSGSSQSIDFVDSFDAPLIAPLTAQDKSENTFTSNSTIALSDIDSSSLTYVTMSDSSPSGSSLSLNWDTDDTPNPTPMATPVRKHAPLNLAIGTDDTNATSDKIITELNGVFKFNNGNINNSQQSSILSSSQQAAPSASSNQAKEHLKAFKQLKPLFPNSGSVDGESNHVPILSQLPSGPSIISKTSIAQNIPLKMSIVSSSSSISQASDSDDNNNRKKAANITISTSAVMQPEVKSWNTIDEKDSHPYDVVSTSSLSKDQTSTYTLTSDHDHYQQSVTTACRLSQGERRRSSPGIKQATLSINSSSNSGNEDSSRLKSSSSSSNIVKRRQSDNFIYSPADSGYGSPLVSGQQSMTHQEFTYSPAQSNQQHFSIPQPHVNSSCNPPIATLIKEPLKTHSKSNMSANISSKVSSDNPAIFLRQTSSQSTESLNSQFSVSSTHQLISKIKKTDLSQPILHRENSNESVHSNGSSGRSDSYRVAMLVDSDEASLVPNKKSNMCSHDSSNSNSSITKNNSGTHRSNVSKSMTIPVSTAYPDEVVNRADSYRCAVRNTQSMLFGDMCGRNTSYRLATCEEDVVITNSRMDGCNLWTGKTGATRNVKRMGITDIDQLKHYSGETNDSDKSGGKLSMAKISNTPHAKKKLSAKTDTEILLNQNKSSTSEQKRFMRSNSKEKVKQKTQSSTYIRFDPIFESGEDIRASNESLRPPSIVSIRTLAKAESNETLTSENAHLIKQRVSSTSPTRRRSSSQGRRDDKTTLSIFGSIKTTIKSIGGTKGE